VGEGVIYRPMQLTDLDDICELENLSFTIPWSRESFVHELTKNAFAKYMVADVEGRARGYCGMWIVLDEAHITNVAVHPDWRGKSLGEGLMRVMMELAQKAGAEKMTLEVRVSNHVAQKLYKKLGFHEEGIRKGYYSDNMEDAIIMWVNLNDNIFLERKGS
jgi:ribosomal-protein-alanine N-acetyltransferase